MGGIGGIGRANKEFPTHVVPLGSKYVPDSREIAGVGTSCRPGSHMSPYGQNGSIWLHVGPYGPMVPYKTGTLALGGDGGIMI